MTTRAINGVYNRSSMAGGGREADPEFYPLLDALRRLQNSGAVSLRLEKHGSDETGILILAGRRAEEVNNDLEFVRKTLGVLPEKNGEVTLTFGALPRNGKEIAVSPARCWESCLRWPMASMCRTHTLRREELPLPCGQPMRRTRTIVR